MKNKIDILDKNKYTCLKKKQIIIYNDNKKIYEIYTLYVIFIATMYQLILGKEKFNKYFKINIIY